MNVQDNINIYYLKGNFFQRIRVLDDIKNSYPDYEISVFDETFSYQYFEQQLLEVSCFSNNKLIIINNWPFDKTRKTSPVNKFKKLLSNISKDFVVVINNLSGINKSFFSKLQDNTKVYLFEDKIEVKKVSSFIIKYFKDKEISDKEANMIVESFGQSTNVNLNTLYLLLKKIEEYVGNKKRITREDVISVCSYSEEFIVWNLFNSLDDKNFNECLRFINILTVDAKSIESQIIKVLLVFLWRYRLLLLIKDYLSHGKKQEEIGDKICKLKKLERKGLSRNIKMKPEMDNGIEKSMYGKKMINSLFNNYYSSKPVISIYSNKELFTINEAINDALIKIRSGCHNSEKIIILEIICMIICGFVKDISKVKILKSEKIIKNI